LFQINSFPKQNILRNYKQIYNIVDASYEEICVEFERKNSTTFVFLAVFKSSASTILNLL